MVSEPHQLAPIITEKQQLYILPPRPQMFKLLTGHLCLQHHSFGHYPQLVTIGEEWNGKLKASPSDSARSLPQRTGKVSTSTLILPQSTGQPLAL